VAEPAYDPFGPGAMAVGMRTFTARDGARQRVFPCDVWYPAARSAGHRDPEPGAGTSPANGFHPLIVFSHFSLGHRGASSFLCRHLASHGYVVAALDHSEVVAPELAPQPGETPSARAARVDAIIASRVPDAVFLLDLVLTGEHEAVAGIDIDDGSIGIAGHSLGGWTALATPDADSRIKAVAAFAPGGSKNPRPGILPLELAFAWGRDVPVLYLAAEDDVSIPPSGVIELYERTPATKRMFILGRADHQHFVDDVEAAHEAVRAMTLGGAAAWIPAAMKPISELCTGEQAHLFVRGLTLAHFDAALRGLAPAASFLAADVTAELAMRGVEVTAYPARLAKPHTRIRDHARTVITDT
jgi:dienelactone hydrolase